MFDQNNAERTIFSESKLIFSRRLKINLGDLRLVLHRCPKFVLKNKAVVKKKAVSGERNLQRFVFRKYQTKAF